MNTEQFFRQLLIDQSLQSEITSLDFKTLQTVAAKHGYIIMADELDTVLERSPELLEQLQALIDLHDLEFELDEAAMALIAGGNTVDCGNRGGTRPNYFDGKLTI